jgi:hypothetical protein
MEEIQRNRFFFTIIIGAGPAGLCCAYELAKNKTAPILVLDKGINIEKRNHKVFLNQYVEGVGGPGLYGDAKLCIYGRAGTRLTNFYSEKFLDRLANYVDKIFWKFGGKSTKREAPSQTNLKKLENLCKNFALKLRMAYPVRHLGSKEGRSIVQKFTNWLKEHQVVIQTETQAIKISKTQKGYKVILKRKNEKKEIVECKYLIIGVGRSGNQWLKKQCETLFIPFSQNIPDIGIRVECSKNVLRPIHTLVRNPRIELQTKNGYVKTHCLCMGGEIIVYPINNSLFVDGHTNHKERGNAHINLLYHSFEDKLNTRTKIKKPVIQRMEDFIKNRLSKKREIIKKNKLSPTAPLIFFKDKGNINEIYPYRLTLSIKKFIACLNRICPGFNNNDNLIYAPVVEWNTWRIKVNKEMETKQKNLYIIGDGSGLTQGIIAAGATGIIAARSIISKEKRRTSKSRCPLK